MQLMLMPLKIKIHITGLIINICLYSCNDHSVTMEDDVIYVYIIQVIRKETDIILLSSRTVFYNRDRRFQKNTADI